MRWKLAYRPGWTGKLAGCSKQGGRKFVCIDGRDVAASVLAWVIMTGEWPHLFVDHVDGDPSNDRWANLRLASPVQNQHNLKPLRRHNRSGVKGVSFVAARGRWKAAISINGKSIFLGEFLEKEDAARAYADAAVTYHREFARF